MDIKVEKKEKHELDSMGVFAWPVWEKEPSEFPWEYDSEEKFYVIEGRAEVTTDSGTASFGAGDFVTMPSGLKCTWKILEKIRKHYNFG